MQHSKIQKRLFFTNLALNLNKIGPFCWVNRWLPWFIILPALFAFRVNADVLQNAITSSEKMSPAGLFNRDALLFNNKKLTSVRISPNGERLFFIVKEGAKQQLWSHNIKEGVNQKLFSSNMLKNGYWTQDSQSILLSLDSGVAIIDMATDARPSIIINLDKNKEQYFWGPDNASPHHFFVWLKELSNNQKSEYVLYRVNRNGEKQKLFNSETLLTEFLAPNGGPLRFITETVGLTTRIYDVISGEKQEIYQCFYTDYCGLLRYQKQTNTLYIKGRGDSDLIQLMALSLATSTSSTKVKTNIGKLAYENVHRDPEQRFDLDNVIFDSQTSSPIMASYHTDFYENYGLSEGIQHHINNIKQQLSSTVVKMVPSTTNTPWLIEDANPAKPHKRYYLYQPHSQQLTEPLADVIQALQVDTETLSEEDLAMRVAIEYKASDGMALQGYVTLPRGMDVRTIPLVVNVHGGPFNRLTGDNTKMAQFLANRGYGVFEPNFRASEGFGRKYMRAANRDFGNGRVQQDIDEGVEYLLQRGIGDRNRLAIMGGSFGGFSTLTGLTFSPDLYQVGIAMAPGTALTKTAEFFIKQADEKEKANVTKVFADRMVDVTNPIDVKRSNDKSPFFHMSNITKSLYILAGEQDDKVSILNVRNYASQLESLGKDVTLLSAPNEGHRFMHPTAVEAKFYLIEKALNQHIGGKLQKSLSQQASHFLKKHIVIGSNQLLEANQGAPHDSAI